MSKFLKALASVGLVELDTGARAPAGSAEANDGEMSAEEARRLVQEVSRGEKGRSAEPAAPPPPPPRAAPPGDGPIAEGAPLEEIYGAAGLRPSPFPAEKLLRLVEGLRAMDAATRKAAILAMDAADDAWRIEDPVLDAKKKIGALDAEKARLAAAATAAEDRARGALADRDKYLAEAADTIKKQIAELESLLQREVEKVAAEKAEIAAQAKAARDASTREARRLDQEIERLSEISRMFEPPPAAPRKS